MFPHRETELADAPLPPKQATRRSHLRNAPVAVARQRAQRLSSFLSRSAQKLV